MKTEVARTQSPIYDSRKRGPVALEELRGIVQYRDLIFQLIRRDVVSRYKRSVLGVAWTMLQPLGMMLILTVVFSQLFHRVQGFSVYLLSGLIAWTFFAQSTQAAMHQMVWGGTLLKHIYLPRTAFVVAAVGTGVVNLLLSLVPLVIVMFVSGHPAKWSILMLPYSILLLTAFSLGVALLLSTLAVNFPDVAEMYTVVVYGWMYLTPIIWPVSIIPETARFQIFQLWALELNPRYWLLNLNPMYHLVQLFRLPVYDGVVPNWPTLAFGTAIAVVALLTGWLVFSNQADEFTYRT